MIRILQLGMTFSKNGTECFIMNLYRSLDREKIQFDFLLEKNYPKLAFEDEIIQMGGRIFREYLPRNKRKKGYSLEDFFSKHPEINGVHYNFNRITTWFDVLVAAKKQNIPIRVMHSHNNGYMNKISYKNKLYEIYAKCIMKYVATDFLCCSKEAGEWAFGNTRTFKVINNSINIDLYALNLKKREEIRKKWRIDDKVVLGFVGRLQNQKNVLFLIDIFAEYKKYNSNSILVINGDGELREQIECKLKALNLISDVILTGSVDNIHEWMQAFDYFVLPSRFEGFGIVLIEAQASGLKCFTSKEVVPNITNVTGNVEFIDLKESPNYWANRIINTEYKRIDQSEIISNAGYDLSTLEKQMSKIYYSCK